jgi:hypothetical protein
MELNEYVCGPQGAAVPLTCEQQLRADLAVATDKLRDIRTLCELARVEGERLTPGEVLTIIETPR